MRKCFWMLVLCLTAAVVLPGCKSTPPPEDLQPVPEALDDPNGGMNGGRAGLDSMNGDGFGQSGSWKKGAGEESFGKRGPGSGADADGWTLADPSGNRLGMPIIYFAYDSDMLISSETEKLNSIAEYMSTQPALGLVIEGHCDQRGTDEYNRALGERRANAIRAYLAGRGVADNRIKTVSYGKEKPEVQGSGEEVWKQNRRGVPVPMKMAN